MYQSVGVHVNVPVKVTLSKVRSLFFGTEKEKVMTVEVAPALGVNAPPLNDPLVILSDGAEVPPLPAEEELIVIPE